MRVRERPAGAGGTFVLRFQLRAVACAGAGMRGMPHRGRDRGYTGCRADVGDLDWREP